MEWLVLAALGALACALVAWLPLAAPQATTDDALSGLERERAALLAELAELDDDAAASRITADDRLAGRRALAPRLRVVVEALRDARAAAPSERSPR